MKKITDYFQTASVSASPPHLSMRTRILLNQFFISLSLALPECGHHESGWGGLISEVGRGSGEGCGSVASEGGNRKGMRGRRRIKRPGISSPQAYDSASRHTYLSAAGFATAPTIFV